MPIYTKDDCVGCRYYGTVKNVRGKILGNTVVFNKGAIRCSCKKMNIISLSDGSLVCVNWMRQIDK